MEELAGAGDGGTGQARHDGFMTVRAMGRAITGDVRAGAALAGTRKVRRDIRSTSFPGILFFILNLT
jgi:hypothetical protein